MQEMKLKSVAVIRETMMSIEFSEQAHEAMEAGAFQPASDSELTSAESAIIAARLSLDEMSQLIEDLQGKVVAA